MKSRKRFDVCLVVAVVFIETHSLCRNGNGCVLFLLSFLLAIFSPFKVHGHFGLLWLSIYLNTKTISNSLKKGERNIVERNPWDVGNKKGECNHILQLLTHNHITIKSFIGIILMDGGARGDIFVVLPRRTRRRRIWQ